MNKETNKRHIRRKVCVRCSTKWEIEWYDQESFVERVTCPLHRSDSSIILKYDNMRQVPREQKDKKLS